MRDLYYYDCLRANKVSDFTSRPLLPTVPVPSAPPTTASTVQLRLCPISTEGWTKRVHFVRGGVRGGGAPCCLESAAPALTAGARQATMAWGVEARVPFLDKDFMEVVMSLDPDSKLIRKGQVPPPPCHTRCCRSAAHSMLQVSRCAFSVTVGDERVLCCLAQETQFIEKWVMRAAFDCDGPDGEKYLPQEVLFRFRPSPVLSGHVSSFPPY